MVYVVQFCRQLASRIRMGHPVPLSIIRSFSLYTQQWYMSYRFADSLRAGSGWNILILFESCLQTCMTYTIAVCTVKNSWWWTEELSETCRISVQNKFEKLVHLVGFLILLASCLQACVTYTIAVLQWKTPDDGQRNCPKFVKFPSKKNLRS